MVYLLIQKTIFLVYYQRQRMQYSPTYTSTTPSAVHRDNGAYHKFFLQIRLFSLTLSPIVLQKQTSKIMGDFNYLHITGVNNLPGYHAAAAFTTKSSEVFKEAEEIFPC